MPTPVSRTRITACPAASTAVETITCPPGSLNFTAFDIRFSMICLSERSSTITRGRRSWSETRMMMRSRAACGCISETHSRMTLLASTGGEREFELARFDLAQIEQVVGETHHMAAGSVDVLEIVLVALVADRAETLLHHHFGEAEDGVQRRADFVADLGEKIGLGRARGLGGVARGNQAPLGLALAG